MNKGMDKKPDSIQNPDQDSYSKLGIKVKGDLGALQIVETNDSEYSDDEKSIEKYDASEPEDTITAIPGSLLQTGQVPVVKNVAITGSENIQFGNNTYFHGPVVIKQIINKKGVDNPSYTSNDNDNENVSTPVSPEKPRFDEPFEKKFTITPWFKVLVSLGSVIILGFTCALILYIQGHAEKKSQEDKPSNYDPEAPVKETNYTTVVGICYDNFEIILFTIIVVPITIMLILYSLLTTQNSDSVKNMYQANGVPQPRILDYPQGEFNNSIEPTVVKADPLLISPTHLRIVSRTDWLAQPVEHELDKIRQPVPWVVITHTATEGCYNQSQCVLRVRLIQMFHIESKDWDDIAYNFLVAGDGSAYFGRGWDYIGAHTLGYNRYSIGIGFVGTFNSEVPPQKQIEACQKLIKLGVQLGKIAKDYKLFAHRQLASTLSPGDKLYDIIKEWPHFVKNDANLEELIPKGY